MNVYKYLHENTQLKNNNNNLHCSMTKFREVKYEKRDTVRVVL